MDITEGRMVVVLAGSHVIGERGVLTLTLGNEAEVVRGLVVRYRGTQHVDDDDLKNAPIAMVLSRGGTVKFLSATTVAGLPSPIPAGRQVEILPTAMIVIGRQRPR